MTERFTRQNRTNPSTEVTSGPTLTSKKKATQMGGLFIGFEAAAYPNSMVDSGISPCVSKLLSRAHCMTTNATYAGFRNA